MMNRLKQYAYLLRLDRPIGIYLLLWPSLWALWLASPDQPPMTLFLIFVAGVLVMRSAGCIINDMADRRYDPFVRRTAERPLASKQLSLLEAFIMLAILGGIALFLVLQLNRQTFYCALIGALLTLIYPFMKRFTHLPQVGLGFAFTWGIPMAFMAEQGHLPWQGVLLFLTAFLWPIIYDTFCAMVDREDDLKIGVKSTAILFGRADRFITGLLQIIFLIGLVAVGAVFHLNVIYDLSLVVVSLLFLYQQFLIRAREPAGCFKAFINNHWVGAVIFLGIFFARA